MAEDLFKDFDKFKRKREEGTKEEKEEKEVVIKFKYKPIMLERAIYWVVILVLLVLVLFNPLSNVIKFEFNRSVAVGETVEVGDAVISDVEENETSDEETQTDDEETTDNETTPILSGKITMAITGITVEDDDEGDPKKITEIKFSIENQKEDFRPKILVYWYDDTDMPRVKDQKRIEVTFPTLFAGSGKDYKITKFTSKYITDYQDDEKLYVKLYDADTDELITQKSKLIT